MLFSSKKNKVPDKDNLYPLFLVSEINKRLIYYTGKYRNSPCILRKAIEYSIRNGGKRFRPVLCLLVAKSLGRDYYNILPAACAIEFIHTYSLIHDDLPSMDNDDFRRGKPSCHRKFGEDIAILTGDTLFAEAFNLVLKYQNADDRIKVKVLEEIAGASGAEGMAAGQVVDVYFTGKRISKKKLEYMHSNKTGKLITASVRCGAILSEAGSNELDKFTEYSKNLGLAFQITDDILDVTSSRGIIGKTAGKDSMQKKNTFPDMWGVAKSRSIAEEKVNKAISIVESMDIDREWLVKIARFLISRKA
jgi:geranylgeranyl diphosphate synthase, type II